MIDFINIEFTEKTKYKNLKLDFEVGEIYIDKSTIGNNDNEKLNYNFLAVGRKNNEAKKLISQLSNHRFYLVGHKNGISLFKKFVEPNSFLANFKDKNVKVWNDTFYTLEEPEEKDISGNRLLVVFSSIADLPFNASIKRRMFFTNFDSVAKYIPKNTYILRIADIGGVLGSFYLNSNADMQFEEKVQNLIRKIQLDYSIIDDFTVLYGTSKGATGALYHGITMGLKSLVVDPIISDEFYINKFNDLHFVRNVFPYSKQEVFSKLFEKYREKDLFNINLVTSPNSEQFQYVSDMILIPELRVCSYVFNNPNIKGHTDMGKHTLNFVVSMLNNLLYGIEVKNNLLTSY
ncbi:MULTISPECIES: XcbB/CpsF family capsular polysaccharide biosynthesis protein [unclassified Avibacterium]|uniref:XcbB/CpsF family capsular polysaccharide biosynthesis protein n=1 Tax=unclassified Avibacterium TaxID=2685287 RepID=UPI0020262402|nr:MULTISPECIES: XcbB/CpsF family capsular polysaccharide biosynthesis protein [unclassified Avibacterium]MCW9698296.1 XcbB/CpsF family capsular polysaccharide biosynthesis protein [Avibacterium sp. 20-129]URL07458.1 XcbB/CpsF family capsular polysaccharide biosynthesis protein [Avibacterium sp. 21-595]